MALKAQIFVGGVWVDANVRLTNGTGTPVVSAVDNGTGEGIADIYTLAFSDVIAGTSANVTIGTQSPNNKYKGRVRAVALDGVTVHNDVIPGVGLVFSNNGGFLATWTATVNVGTWLGTFDAFGVGAGVPSAGERVRVQNTGTGVVSGAKAQLEKRALLRRHTGNALASIKPFADGATVKMVGGTSQVTNYALTIANIAGAGAGKTCDLAIDGVTFGAASLRDLSNNAAVSGVGLKAIAGQSYRVLTGPLTDLEFSIDPTCANGDRGNVTIWLDSFVEIAPDVAGVEGAYGTADVTLTEAGQAAGVILAGGFAYFWRRLTVAAGGNAESNPYPGNIKVTAVEGGAADI
jgi:hypothetical protein